MKNVNATLMVDLDLAIGNALNPFINGYNRLFMKWDIRFKNGYKRFYAVNLMDYQFIDKLSNFRGLYGSCAYTLVVRQHFTNVHQNKLLPKKLDKVKFIAKTLFPNKEIFIFE